MEAFPAVWGKPLVPFCTAQFRRISQERDQIFLRNHIVFV